MSRAAYCRCVGVQNYDYDEAAAKLKCKRRFLEDRIRTLPHQKIGGSVSFCDCELALIQAMFTVLPPGVLDLLAAHDGQQEETEPATVRALASISPSGARSKRSAS
jgi:hypothetical protein